MASHFVKDTAGALLIGALTTMVLYGITTIQTFYYYISFPKDGVISKALVLLIWMLDTIHIILVCQSVYSYTILEYGDPLALQAGNWSLIMSMLMNLVMICLIQSAFTYRIFLLCPIRWRWWVAGCITFLVICHAGFGIATCVFFFMKRKFDSFQQVREIVALFAVFDVLSDVSISASLCKLLWGHRSGFEDTNMIVTRLVVFLVNRSILTCAVAIIESIIFVALPHTLYFLAIDFLVGKLYVNSFLAVLNSRIPLRPKTDVHGSIEMSTRFIVCPHIPEDHLSIQVHKEVETSSESYTTSVEKDEQKRSSQI